MKVALSGYGKMGREIEKTALESGHSISLVLDNEHDWIEKASQLTDCDVAIEFSTPAFAVKNIKRCLESGVPLIIGTTGWYDQLAEIVATCESKNGTLFYASNFSIGVNIFFEISRRLAALLKNYPAYRPSINEIHHSQKLDAPSGTAISMANDVIAANNRFCAWTKGKASESEIPLQSIREGTVPGTHTITWDSEIDKITLTHEAKSRHGFAIGAVMAAEWIQGRKGIYTMKDLLNL